MGANVLVAGRYRLDEPLAQGGMGAVWRGTDTNLHRPVAVKVLALEGDETLTERFHLEARAAARLNHPNLVAAYDFGDHDGRPYLVMELVEGRSLSQELTARGPLDPDRAADLAAQTARGLAAAHQQSVVHRDIKPGNLLLAADGTVKIADFGIARLIDEVSPALTATGHVMGSSSYLAPERVLGSPAVTASDVYSLGCVLYEMLTGRTPFRGDTPAAVAHQHVVATPTPPELLRPGLPAHLTDLLLQLMAKSPEARPTADRTADWLSAPGGRAEPAAVLSGPAPGAGPAADTTALLTSTVALPVLPPPPAGPAPSGAPARARRSPRTAILITAAGALAFATAVVLATTARSSGGGGDLPAPRPAPSAPAAFVTSTPSPPADDAEPAPESAAAPIATASPDRPHHGHGKKGHEKDERDDG
ncbi:serine/threonine-protein kinase [Streptomyces sp.]|uniref:serine/threonine-protein kinase n=1 Tax=Streptomyces sp. TaxID=1931 RepID=UPI002F3FC2BB